MTINLFLLRENVLSIAFISFQLMFLGLLFQDYLSLLSNFVFHIVKIIPKLLLVVDFYILIPLFFARVIWFYIYILIVISSFYCVFINFIPKFGYYLIITLHFSCRVDQLIN